MNHPQSLHSGSGIAEDSTPVKLGARGSGALFLLLILASMSCERDPPTVSPPNIEGVTRLLIQWPRGTLGYFVGDDAIREGILSSDEEEYIRSFEAYVISEPERIGALANDLRQGVYAGHMKSELAWGAPVVIAPYNNGTSLESFTIYGSTVVAGQSRFEYPSGVPDLENIEPPAMLPFKRRYRCALNLGRLYTAGPLWRRRVEEYPPPGRWCDAIMETLRNRDSVHPNDLSLSGGPDGYEELARVFVCPCDSAGGVESNAQQGYSEFKSRDRTRSYRRSYYAMNPECKPSSPPDMVLLFESTVGWNQCGGPELFVFHHHEPRGGLVLLNDGTIRFIRSEDDLRALRWE